MDVLREILRTQFRLLTFRSISPDLRNHAFAYFAYIFLVTWLVGIGRYWDHPRAEPWQYAGLGSVAYIFVLSAFLWLVVLPLQPENWRYHSVLLFVGLTSLPAALYAVPVERFMSLDGAQSANAVFLGVVAVWRVALYVKFLHGAARLHAFRVFVATLLPLSAIVAVLAVLNLEHVIFDIMAGIREGSESQYDTAYGVVFILGMLSYVAFPVTLILYVAAIFVGRRRVKRETPAA